MTTSYLPLSHVALGKRTTYHQPANTYPLSVSLESPATDVMTDLLRVAALTVSPGQSVSAANDKMIAHAVRLLLVTDPSGCILGLVSATDILGEKQTQFMLKTNCARSDIQVQDIMTPLAKLEVLHMVDVERAQVGNIVETLKRAGRQHLLVADVDEETSKMCVRGIFSSTQISRQLGVAIDVPEIAHTFAELEAALIQ